MMAGTQPTGAEQQQVDAFMKAAVSGQVTPRDFVDALEPTLAQAPADVRAIVSRVQHGGASTGDDMRKVAQASAAALMKVDVSSAAPSEPAPPGVEHRVAGGAGPAGTESTRMAPSQGAMQSLLASLPAAAPTAANAATQFTLAKDKLDCWIRHGACGADEVATPAGALSTGLDALRQADRAVAAKQQALRAQNGSASSDPNAMRKQMRSAPPLTDAQQATIDKIGEMLDSMTRRGMQQYGSGMSSSQQTMAKLDEVLKQQVDAHRKVDAELEAALRSIPHEKEAEAGGGCYTAANATRARKIEAEYATHDVAVADQYLAQVAPLLDSLRQGLAGQSQDVDALTAAFAPVEKPAMQNPMTRMGVAARVVGEPANVLRGLREYVNAVVAADREAAMWVYKRDALVQQPLDTCR
jgi:hypothetical protein